MSRKSCITLAVTAVLIAACSTSRVRAAELTLAERVDAHRAIVATYEGFQAASRTRPTAPPDATLDATRVLETLRLSVALERIWDRPLTGEVLGRELARVLRDTRDPERLRQLFAVLGDDPLLIQESLIRPTLARRLARRAFDRDPRIHGAARRAARDAFVGLSRGEHAGLPLPIVREIVRDAFDADDFERVGSEWLHRAELPSAYVVARLADDPFFLGETVRIETYAFPRPQWAEWWSRTAATISIDSFNAPTPLSPPAPLSPSAASCALGTGWDSGILDGREPLVREDHSLVWTGTELLLWGGYEWKGWGAEVQADGFRYDPVFESWSGISSTGGPGPRAFHHAVWTGTTMIVWGGWDGGVGTHAGSIYDPQTDVWTPMSTTGAPAVRSDTVVVWTGSELIVWGGETSQGLTLDDGARYDPQTDVWTPMADAGAPVGRSQHSGVWTGSEFIVWGGAPTWNTYVNSGGRYDPTTDTWTPTTTADAPAPRRRHVAEWTGNEMIVFGGGGDLPERSGGRYDPATDTWTPIADADSSLSSGRSKSAWSGDSLLVELELTGFTRYSPATDRWSTLGCNVRGEPAWTGDELLVWGDWNGFATIEKTGSRIDPDAGTCAPMLPPPDPPAGRRDHTSVWTGAEVIVWGGRKVTYDELGDGKRYDPTLDAWTAVSGLNAPSKRRDHSAVWTGTEMIVWGGESGDSKADGARYDPLTDSWSTTSTADAPAPRSRHPAVWTGSEMIVWGGFAGVALGGGGRYDPVTDGWLPLTTVGEPSARFDHTAVWTGSELIVWGGSQVESLDTGGRYDPASGSWTDTTTTGAPQERFGHTAVWTGSEMIVWGGNFALGPDLGDGARYDPQADGWTTISTVGAPQARFWHTAAWSGHALLVWGGRTIDGTLFDDGATYSAASDSWTPLAGTDAPPPRYGASGSWTGDALVVWGGAYSENQNSGFEETGGRYVHSPDDDGDGTGLACDCAPADPGAFAVPGEIDGLRLAADATTLVWDSAAPHSGTDTVYQVVRGDIGALPVGSAAEQCLTSGTASVSFSDAAEPVEGAAFYYLVRGVNVCSAGPYGNDSQGQPRVSSACP